MKALFTLDVTWLFRGGALFVQLVHAFGASWGRYVESCAAFLHLRSTAVDRPCCWLHLRVCATAPWLASLWLVCMLLSWRNF